MFPASNNFLRVESRSEKVPVWSRTSLRFVMNMYEALCIRFREARETGIDEGFWAARRAKIT
jgi:hypothetical protein